MLPDTGILRISECQHIVDTGFYEYVVLTNQDKKKRTGRNTTATVCNETMQQAQAIRPIFRCGKRPGCTVLWHDSCINVPPISE